jgi:uncharacterized MAPEG superfamily protein
MLTTPLACLLGFVGWTVLLVLALASWRGVMVLRRERAINAFPSGLQHGSDPYWRLNRAHLNCLENVPLFASVVLVGHVAGVQTPLFATLATVYLVARIVQSLVHISSGSAPAVWVRFSAFSTQIACLVLMGVEILKLPPLTL